ncbi:MAG TPA: DUF1707 domain-containing protein [Longimicrobiales bacterium]|nr:DUF1707 domain-containing protein [Longimicrobiales bacterium]
MDASEGAGLPAVPLQSRREQTIATLCEHFSRDNLTVEEFERRLDAAHRVQTMPELTQLLQDLPALPIQPTAPAATTSSVPKVASHAREHQHFVAIMGGVDKRGVWQPAQKTYCYVLMGGVALDYREALLPPGETELTIIAMMGGAEIIVPPDMRVDCDGIAIMGGFDHGPEMSSADAGAPVLRINGFCLMGGVEITVRKPGESAKDARIRRREEKKRLKRG